MSGSTINLDETAEKPWEVFEFYDDNGLTGNEWIGVFDSTTAEEATALACENEPWLDRDLLSAFPVVPQPIPESQLDELGASNPPF
jgi:hypothetical protein